MKTKLCLLLSALVLCTGLLGCSPKEDSLYAQGLKISGLMSEMAANQEYLTALTHSEEIANALSGVSAPEPGAPKTVYQITLPEDILLELLGTGNVTGLSKDLKENLIARSYCEIAPMLNGQLSGSIQLAASSLCTVKTCFSSSGFSGNVIYLYVYQSGAPVMVAFTAGEGNAVNVSGSYILADEFTGEIEDQVKDLFQISGIKIKEITEK